MIIATADNHLGYRQYGLKSREIDIQNSFKAIIDAAINTSSDITISGDLLHSNRPTSQTMAFLKQCHFNMIKNGITAYVISGNHDKSNPSWISHFHSDHNGFRDIDNQTVLTGVEGSQDRLKIRGVPFCNKNEWDETVIDINNSDPIDILLMHQSFSEFTNFDNPEGFSAASLEKINPKKCRLIIVGDTHVTDRFITGNGIVVLSPGSSEVISMSEDYDKYVFYINRKEPLERFKDEGEELFEHQLTIPTRPCYNYDIPDRKTLEDVIEAIITDVDKNPIINIKCNYELQSELERIKNTFSDEAVLRFRGYNPEVEERIIRSKDAIGVSEVLDTFIDTRSESYALAVKLTNADCDARYEIDAYIEGRLNDLQTPKLPIG